MKNGLGTLAFIILVAGCIKPRLENPFSIQPPELPAITQDGRNTFGCFVNDTLYLPGGYFGKSPVTCDYTRWQDYPPHAGRLSIKTSSKALGFFNMTIGNGVTGPGRYLVYNNNKTGNLAMYLRGGGSYRNYAQDTNSFIDISRLDTINRIVSGTFQFNAPNEITHIFDRARITSGRFDLRY